MSGETKGRDQAVLIKYKFTMQKTDAKPALGLVNIRTWCIRKGHSIRSNIGGAALRRHLY